ncbi:MAG TPA: alpha/beta hydrolase [Allosphingosinicella sp.]|jgi:pimeloyl-ACP methyl ester carboxylesterase|nr:alpha/beta hydrolase [Allosphingosinicella sp.]
MIRTLLISAAMLPLAACATAAPTGQTAPVEAPRAPFASERIGVTVRGSGPDVVLVPGLTSSPEVWESTIAAVPGYRYHLVHVSGFAGRPAGANASGPVVEPVAEEIARYIREAGLSRPAIVGHSLGGTWAMLVAGRNPGLVSRAMVVDMMPAMGAMFGGPNATAETLRPAAEQMRTGIAAGGGPARRPMAEQTIASMVRTEPMRAAAVEHSMTSEPTVVAQAMYDLILADLRPEVSRIRVPLTVLYVRPPNAPVTDEQMAGYYTASYAGAPHARVVRIPDSYHFIMWDAPEAFQRELSALLAAR